MSQNSGGDIKLIVTQSEDVKEDTKVIESETLMGKSTQAMATLQLYCASVSGESSMEPSPSPSPIPVVPSLTTNFPLLPTSPLRYPHPLQPVFYRMATPPNIQPQKSRCDGRSPRLACQESLESEGDEDREAILSLQVFVLIRCKQVTWWDVVPAGQTERHFSGSGIRGADFRRVWLFGTCVTGAFRVCGHGQFARCSHRHFWRRRCHGDTRFRHK